MKLFYYEDPAGNFGDELNRWLWPRIAPGLLDNDDSCLFIGIGSILDQRIPAAPDKIVFGTGIGYGRLPAVDERWKIYCVRGPLTAQALGLPSNLAVTDAAAFVGVVVPSGAPKENRVAFIPHFRSPERASQQGVDLRQVIGEAGINYIDPCGGVEVVLRQIARSDLVFAEAMHGAIVADSLRVPWVPVQLYDHICDLKWWDWCKSLRLEYRPAVFSPDSQTALALSVERFVGGLLNSAKPMLSQQSVLEAAVSELQERLHQLRSGGGAAKYITGSAQLSPDPQVLKGTPWLYEIQLAIQEIADVLPPGSDFILVDEDQWGGQVLAGRHCTPFLERDGHYWGLPPDDDTAVRELERARGSGAEFMAFVQPAFWWLDYYSGMYDYLRLTYRLAHESPRVVVFDLRGKRSGEDWLP